MDRSTFVSIKAWFTPDQRADVEIAQIDGKQRLRRRKYYKVSHASVHRLMEIAEPLKENIRLSVYW